MSYYYLKSEIQFSRLIPQSVVQNQKLRLLSLFLFFFGVGILSWVIWPFLEWQTIYVPRFNDVEIMRPVPLGSRPVEGGISVAGQSDDDLSARNWFPQVPKESFTESSARSYTLSIPKLKIQNAQVIAGSENLEKSLIQWRGPLPPQKGTALIFGHSVLPQFFNPKNYKSIFSTLHTLKIGDEIIISQDKVIYKYKIFGQEIINPDEFDVLEQRNDDSYVYLITCNPPGTFWKRLVVKARLESL